MSDKISLATKFATDKHSEINHVRKYTGEPYITHPLAVATIIKDHGASESMICAAILHDTVEDTNTSIDEIKKVFGNEVASLVDDLTDVAIPEDGNRAHRMQINLNHTATGSADAHTIKLADLIDNSKSIIEHDPKFAKIYMKEKANLLTVLKDGNKELYQIANKIIEDFYRD